MIRISDLLERAEEFSKRIGLFSIKTNEFFAFITDLILKVREVTNRTTLSLIYQSEVATFADLGKTYPNPEIGWTAFVRANGTRYVWNGEKWVDLETSDWATKQDLKTALDFKADKVTGKGLSTNDYTNAEKQEVGKVKDKADKTVGGKNVVYGSIATASTEAQKDNLVNVGLMNTETAKINWHIKNIEESDFSIVGYWGIDGEIRTTATYIRTKLFKVKKGQKFRNPTQSESIFAASAAFFDRNNKFIIGYESAIENVVAPEDGYVGFSKRDLAPDKNVYVTQDFWATQQDNLIAAYVHQGNKEVRINSIDYDTNTFTSMAHGLVNGNTIAVNFKIDAVDKSIATVLPIKDVTYRGLYVINATDNTFQLSRTQNSTAVTLVNQNTVDNTLYWFEVVVPINMSIRNIDVTNCHLDLTGVFNGLPQYISIEYGDNYTRAGSRGIGWRNTNDSVSPDQGYDWQRILINGFISGNLRADISLNTTQGVLSVNKVGTVVRLSDTLGKMKVEIVELRTITTVPNASSIRGIYLSDGFILCNGATIKIFKK